jgi:drug/metabolite transporter (DMT)-like permease
MSSLTVPRSPSMRHRRAVAEAHRAVFQRHASRALLEMADTLSILSSSTEGSGQSFASKLPSTAATLLIDATPHVRALYVWQFGERLRWLDTVAWVVAVVAAGGAIWVSRQRRAAVFDLGIGIAVAERRS